MTVTLQKAEGGAKQVLTAPLSFGSTPLYHDIADAQQFKDVMTKYGQNYENFRITGEIDLSQVSDVPLNLKINRLVGAGSGHTISNLSYQIQSQGQSLFQVLTGTMENLTFKDMTVTSASSSTVSGGENVGLISINQGEIRNTSFENIAITAPSRSQKTGLIGTNMGTVKNVNLKDIQFLCRRSLRLRSIRPDRGHHSDRHAGSKRKLSVPHRRRRRQFRWSEPYWRSHRPSGRRGRASVSRWHPGNRNDLCRRPDWHNQGSGRIPHLLWVSSGTAYG